MSEISEEDLQCPVCYDIFTDPVLLLCSHSLCRACYQQLCSTRGFHECPICRKRFTGCHPPNNLALRNVCESFLQKRNVLCDEHREKLRLFCLDDKHPVCLVCRDSEKHRNHTFRPVDEVAPLLKEELKTALKHLQEKLESFKEIKESFDDAAQHIKTQAQQTVRCLQEEFERLHQFLRDEEMLRISALIEEENQKSQMMNERIEQIDREIESLSNNIRAIKDDLDAANMPFLQNFMFSEERAQITLQDPEIPTGALMNVPEHLGNLRFKVWEKMQEIVTITALVTLDPNTAYPLLFLSDDLTHVKSSADGQQYPENPERFDYYHCVLGSEGFNSGQHCWDVEVENNTCWSVGVTTASNQRKGNVFFDTGAWRVRYMAGQYTSQSPLMTRTHLAVEERLKVIRVKLDWDGGTVSFSDPLTNTHLCTFISTFTETIFPFLYSSCTDFPLRILPVKFSITVEEPK
ncbi:E3 ubiquitin-protein ligase TRIM35-like isoform X1 [Megalobrama amblycephala]|uniref:E3 ubiquitin-protein ligase TRIM35-like isoform X1 n=1 Tax=Megalobrama amblycephala TaxID=75352 RepID=UPI002013CA94|nr:E3 ubiquitin-protein ligase TRIM35-like isoform X1 [Megalobrama amblycephala]